MCVCVRAGITCRRLHRTCARVVCECEVRTSPFATNAHVPSLLTAGIGANLVGVSPEKAIKLAVNDLLREVRGGAVTSWWRGCYTAIGGHTPRGTS